MERAEVANKHPSKPVAANQTREFVDRIHSAWRKSVEGIIEAGRLLIEAKAQIEPGHFQTMITEQLPFSTRTARALMSIARHPLLSNRKHACDLPPSWGTLYQLTKLPDDTLRAKIADGTITPKIERRDVVAMRRGKKQPNKRLPSAEPIAATVAYVRARIEEIGVARRAELIRQLRELLEALAGTAPAKPSYSPSAEAASP